MMLSKSCTLKYIDDASEACSIRQRKTLSKINISKRHQPLEFCEHTGYIINNHENLLQEDLDKLKVFTDKNIMVIIRRKPRA